MQLSRPFIMRPIATSLLTIAALLLGTIGYAELPVAALPTVDLPTILVSTSYPGAAPDVMAEAVTGPLEHYFGQIAGLTSMTSVSSEGNSQITLQFDLSRRAESAAEDVQAQINASADWIPTDQLPSPPVYREVNPADAPVLSLALASDTLPLQNVEGLAETVLVQRLSQIDGVGAVSTEGDQRRAVRLEINPARLAGLGLSMEDIRAAVSATTADLPKGSLEGPHQAFQIGANDQLFAAKSFLQAVVAYRNGAPVLLGDVGRAVEGVENADLSAWYAERGATAGKPAVILDIQRRPGANVIAVADRVKALLPALRAALPPTLKIDIIADRTVTIRASITEVKYTLLLTVALVVAIIFAFLRKLLITLIPSITLPVSLVVTFGGMALLGFSLDNLSLMALTVASGFVVDDAIVMIENITRHLEGGARPIEAALKGAQQIGFTIVSLTVSLVAVFIPLLLMGGVVGRLFREFAVTLSMAVVVSGVVSLTLTPMMCARLLPAQEPGPGDTARGYGLLLSAYGWTLDMVLRHRGAALAFTVVTTIATGMLYATMSKGLLPRQDAGLLIGTTDAPPDLSFAVMQARQQAVADIVARDPAVVAVDSVVGVGVLNPTLNSGRLMIDIGPRDGRADSAAVVMERLGRATASVDGITLHLQPAQDLQIEARSTRTQYQFVLQDLDPVELHIWSNRLLKELRTRPEFADVASDAGQDGERMILSVDRTAAARFGVTMAAVDQALYDCFGQRQITTIYAPAEQYRVILEVDPVFRRDPGILDKIFVTTNPAAPGDPGDQNRGVTAAFRQPMASVPLSAFTRMKKTTAPLIVAHQGLFPATTVSFNLAPDVSLGQALASLDAAREAIGLPDTITANVVGSAAVFADALRSEPLLILAALITVYIVLGVLYESFIHPVTILSTLPSAGLGALLALVICHRDLDVISLIGIILLIGIVKKNAIMMVDFALDAERAGLPPFDAMRQACLLRFRPIMMTTAAALFGALPLAVSTGTGSELRQPLGIAIVGGLIVSQLLTLYTTPVIYLAFSRLAGTSRRRRRFA